MERIDGRIIHDVYLDRVVFRETFTGDGSTTTFTLDGTVGNATFKYGAWSIANVKTTFPAHITKTNKKPAYDSLVPLTRNRISVSSINATTGVVTLDYAPRNTVDFYVWYWYDLPNHHLLEDYYREDFVASIEEEATAYGTDIVVDTTNFAGIFTAADNTVQKAFDTADDHTHALLHAQVHAIDGADHTAAGLTAGHFLKATGATTFGFGVHGLSYGDVGAEASGTMTTHESTYDHANYDTAYGWGDHAGLYGSIGDVAANTAKVTESTTVTSPLVLTTYDISIPAATNSAAGHATAAHIQAIEANTAKNTNVPTALEVGTVGVNTVAITSDGGEDDVTLPAATVDTAGMLTTAKWAEVVANTAKVTCNFTNVQTALGAATGAVDFNAQNLTGVGTIGCGNITGGTYNALTLAAAAVGFTIAGGTTSKTLTVDDNFVVSTQLAAIEANTAKVTESTTVTSPLVLTDYDISIPAATSIANGYMTSAYAGKLDGIETGADVTADNDPKAHNTSHESGGADSIKLDDLATPDDNTDLNASTTRHGLLPKLDDVVTHFLNGQGGWSAPAGSGSGETIKAWIHIDAEGNPPAIEDSFNVDSIVDNATGIFTINWDTDFANANYSINGTCKDAAWVAINDVATGSCQIVTRTTAGLIDRDWICVMAIGDQ